MAHKLGRRATAVILSKGLLAGGSVALAGPAFAVGSYGCASKLVKRLRNGPGTNCTALGLVPDDGAITTTCPVKGYSRDYVTTRNGNKMRHGWVSHVHEHHGHWARVLRSTPSAPGTPRVRHFGAGTGSEGGHRQALNHANTTEGNESP